MRQAAIEARRNTDAAASSSVSADGVPIPATVFLLILPIQLVVFLLLVPLFLLFTHLLTQCYLMMISQDFHVHLILLMNNHLVLSWKVFIINQKQAYSLPPHMMMIMHLPSQTLQPQLMSVDKPLRGLTLCIHNP